MNNMQMQRKHVLWSGLLLEHFDKIQLDENYLHILLVAGATTNL